MGTKGKPERPYTMGQIRKIRELRDQGKTLAEIALEIGRSPSSVNRICRVYGLRKTEVKREDWAICFQRDPSPTRAARRFGVSVSRAKKIKCQLKRYGFDLFEDYERETKYVSKTYPKYATTKYKELGYTMTASREWRFVDLNCPSSTGNPVGPSCVGPHYRSETDLLSDLDNYAEQFGCEEAKARPFVTQPQVDSLVRILQSLSRRCEATKDAKEHESRSFWFWHDAMTYIDQAVAHLTKQKGV